MAKHRRTRRVGRSVPRRRTSRHTADIPEPESRDVPDAISDAVLELQHSTGHESSRLVDQQRTSDGGWLITVETGDPTGSAARGRYTLRLDGAGRMLSSEFAPSAGQGEVEEPVQNAVPVDLGLRADLDTDISISFRSFNIVNLRLRGSIRPGRHSGGRLFRRR